MRLRTKFNLVLAAGFAVGLGLMAVVSKRFINEDVRAEVLENARIMMYSAQAIRTYTSQEIQPLLVDRMNDEFLPHSVPSFAAQANFDMVREHFPEYSYKEAALNPTNLDDRATDWEADIINVFRNNPSLPELVSERETPTGTVLTLARPLVVRDQACLVCHSTPAQAPAPMLAIYGSANGFGWQLGDTIGAQVVSIPMSYAAERATNIFYILLGALAVVFAAVVVLMNLLLQYIVVRPVMSIARAADGISLGNMDIPEFDEKSNDEIGSLAKSFNRMRRSLENALKLLSD